MSSPEPESATRTVADNESKVWAIAHDETQHEQHSWSDRFTGKNGRVQCEWGYLYLNALRG